MPARRRLAAVALAAAMLLVLGFLLWPSRVRDEGVEAPPADSSSIAPPMLAVAPRSLAPRDAAAVEPGERASRETTAAGATATATDAPRFELMPWICVEDDPALPKERVPLDVELVDARGEPIAGALVQAVWGEWRTKASAADESGHVTLNVPRGTRALEIVGAPPTDRRRFLFVHYHSLAGGEPTTRVAVRLGSEITGTLVGPDGAGIANAMVRAVPTAFGYGPAKTDANGAFSLGVLDGTDVDVEFDGTLGPTASSGPSWPSPLRAAATRVCAGTVGLRLVATPATFDAVLALRVLLPSGEPAANAVVWYTMAGRSHGHSTDVSGRVVLSAQERGMVSVEVEAAGWPRQRFDRLLADTGEVTLRLASRTELRGRVVDADGRPVAGAWCAALRGHEYLAAFGTNADGRFATSMPVAPGTAFQLTARFPMDEATSKLRGVINDVVAGRDEPTVVLEDVGLLLAPARRPVRTPSATFEAGLARQSVLHWERVTTR